MSNCSLTYSTTEVLGSRVKLVCLSLELVTWTWDCLLNLSNCLIKLRTVFLSTRLLKFPVVESISNSLQSNFEQSSIISDSLQRSSKPTHLHTKPISQQSPLNLKNWFKLFMFLQTGSTAKT